MMTLRTLLGQTPLDVFLDKHFSRLPFSCAGGASSLRDLLTWTVVEKIFQENKSVLRIVQDGRVIKDYVEMKYSEAREHHHKGHTLLVRFAEKSDQRLKELATEFENFFHSPVDIQLYCTPDKHNAFGWHYDVEEVFILQTQGSKHYTIRPNTVHPLPLVKSIPKNQGYESEKSDLKIEVTLEEGDFLYIPSGWWHIARTQRESMHISIGVMPSSAVDILSFLPDYLASHPFWRTRMPLHKTFLNPEEERLFYSDAMLKIGHELQQSISRPEFIRDFLRSKRKE